MKTFVIISALLLSVSAISEPQVDGVAIVDAGTKLRVTGTGFNAKSQAEPVLWIMGRDVRENGVSNSAYAIGNTSIGSLAPVGDGASDIWTDGVGALFDDQVRYSELGISYLAKGNGWLGWPSAYGGGDTPAGTQAYISLRFLPWWDIESSRAVAYSLIQGDFDTGADDYLPGESVTIVTLNDGPFFARIIHVDTTNKVIHFSVDGLNSSFLEGAELRGSVSGAVAQLDPSTYSVMGTGSKYLRSYENSWVGGGVRVVRSGNRLLAAAYKDNGDGASPRVSEMDRVFEEPDGSDAGYGVTALSDVRDWRLMESYIDLRGAEGDGYTSVDNLAKKWFHGLDLTYKDPLGGPTVSNIGWESAGGTEGINTALNFGEVYFDNTPQRVVISNKANYTEVTKDLEYQYPVTWSDTEITVELRYGAFNPLVPLYLYVFDKDNNVNAAGYALCPTCDHPLKSPQPMSTSQR